MYFNASVLSQPQHIILKSKEMTCEEDHKLNVITLFSVDDKICPQHNKEFINTKGKSQTIEFLSFKVKSGKDEIECFSLNNKELLDKLDMYDKVNIKGTKIVIKTRNPSVFGHGIIIKDIELFEDIPKQRSMLDKEGVINAFMSNMPKLNYPDRIWNAYKQSLLLPLVYTGFNILSIGEAGTLKTAMGYSLKNISGGAYIDVPKSSEVSIMGYASRDMSGTYSLKAGMMHVAKNNVLVLDEVDKFDSYAYLHPLNEVIANHHLSYHKADIKYDNPDFWISLIALGNPIGTSFTSRPAIGQIHKVFERNMEFISRMHLTWGIRNNGFDLSSLMETSKEKDASMEQEVALYIKNAKGIKIGDKDIDEEAKAEQKKYIELQYAKSKDLRFARKFKELCIAEAKLDMKNRVSLNHVKAIEEIVEIQNELLYNSV